MVVVFAAPEPGSPKFHSILLKEPLNAEQPMAIIVVGGGLVKEAVMQPMPLLMVPMAVVNCIAGAINPLVIKFGKPTVLKFGAMDCPLLM